MSHKLSPEAKYFGTVRADRRDDRIRKQEIVALREACQETKELSEMDKGVVLSDLARSEETKGMAYTIYTIMDKIKEYDSEFVLSISTESGEMDERVKIKKLEAWLEENLIEKMDDKIEVLTLLVQLGVLKYHGYVAGSGHHLPVLIFRREKSKVVLDTLERLLDPYSDSEK